MTVRFTWGAWALLAVWAVTVALAASWPHAPHAPLRFSVTLLAALTVVRVYRYAPALLLSPLLVLGVFSVFFYSVVPAILLASE